jgi:hypothetical protein
MRWHYEIESNEEFFNSEILFKSIKLALRKSKSYLIFDGSRSLSFSVSGNDDVILTVYNAELSYNGEYCCNVQVASNNKVQPAKQKCTNIIVYGMM